MQKIAAVTGIVTALLALAGVAFTIYNLITERQQTQAFYPKLEKMIAIYSLVGWHGASQQLPSITEDSEWGGHEFNLDCPDIDWSRAGATNGALFSCFLKEAAWTFEGEKIPSRQLVTSEDYWYEFSWESLFGYEVQVTISPHQYTALYRMRDEILHGIRDNPDSSQYDGQVSIYVVRISGLSMSDTVAFLAASGRIVPLSNGATDLKHEWVVYTEDGDQITLGAINRFIQTTLRTLRVGETDITKAAPMLEAQFNAKDKAFAKGLIAEIKNVPDLSKITKFVSSK